MKDRWKNDWSERRIENIIISASWQEVQCLSNFSVLVGILLGPTDFVESSEYILRATSFLSVGLKKEFWSLFFRTSEKCLWEYLIFTFAWEAMGEKYLLEPPISIVFVIVLSFAVKILGKSDGLNLTLNIDPLQVFSMLFQLISK